MLVSELKYRNSFRVVFGTTHLSNCFSTFISLWLGGIFSAVLTARRPCYLSPAETHQLWSCCVDRKSRWQPVETWFIFIEKYGCHLKRYVLVEVYKEMLSVESLCVRCLINSRPLIQYTQSPNRKKQLHQLMDARLNTLMLSDSATADYPMTNHQ